MLLKPLGVTGNYCIGGGLGRRIGCLRVSAARYVLNAGGQVVLGRGEAVGVGVASGHAASGMRRRGLLRQQGLVQWAQTMQCKHGDATRCPLFMMPVALLFLLSRCASTY